MLEIIGNACQFSTSSVMLRYEKSDNDLINRLTSQLSKTGDTIFKVIDIQSDCDIYGIVPISIINQARRVLLENLVSNISYATNSNKKKSNSGKSLLNNIELDYTANISYKLAGNFYNDRNAIIKENAFELLTNHKKKALMTTKYFIKYDIDDFPRYNNNTQNIHQIMYLEDDVNRYIITFDCKNCFMKISSI